MIYKSHFGITFIYNKKIFVKISKSNITRLFYHAKKISFKNKYVEIKSNSFPETTEKLNDIENLNWALKIIDDFPIDYWKFYNPEFAIFEYPFSDYRPALKYYFLDIFVEKKDNLIKIKFHKKKCIIVIHFLEFLLNELKEENISTKIIIKNSTIEWNFFKIYLLILNTNTIEIETNASIEDLVKSIHYIEINNSGFEYWS